jgi:hypothetical protein
MNDLDQRLTDYAQRWQAAQPPPPTVDHRQFRTVPAIRQPRLWLPLAAAAVAVALVATGIAVLRNESNRAPVVPLGQPIPFAPQPASYQPIPSIEVPERPDPAVAAQLPPCATGDLQLSANKEGAGGTVYLAVTITSTTPCKLSGYPVVTPLGPEGSPVDVPVVASVETPVRPAVAVGHEPVLVTLGWPNFWCAPPVTVSQLRLTMPDGGRRIIEGFGRSVCSATPDGNGRPPITVTPFAPQSLVPAHFETALSGAKVSVALPATASPGRVMPFLVTIQADPSRPVSLSACPDYSIRFGDDNNGTTVEYALNCAAVPYRDGGGQPYIPAGTAVVFGMQVLAPPRPQADAKLVWQILGLPGDLSLMSAGTVAVG